MNISNLFVSQKEINLSFMGLLQDYALHSLNNWRRFKRIEVSVC